MLNRRIHSKAGAEESSAMRRRNVSLLLVALISGLATGEAAANGFGLPDQDAFAAARGEAFVATADNPSAIYYNPAGITQLAGNNFRGGLNSVYYRPGFQPPPGQPNSGQTYDSSDNFAWLPQFFYTHTAKNTPLSLGLGVYAPFGGQMNWPQDTGFRAVAISGSLQYITINPVVAIKVSPGLSVGGGVMVNYGKISLSQGLEDDYSERAINYFNFNGDGWSMGYNLGILWQPLPRISFGAAFRSSASLNFKGNTDFQLGQQPYPTPEQRDASAEFTFPLTAVFGVSYRPTPKWNLEFDANYTDWSSFGTVTIEQSPPPVSNPLLQDIPLNLAWQASWMFEFGVTRYFESGWHVSAGYAFNQNSVPNQYYTPLAADLDRHFFSVGGGFKGKTFDFDVAYQFGYDPAHAVAGSTSSTAAITASSGETADGTYHFISHAVFVSVGVHF
jgi:long-chain fatty acid transport protein